MSGIRAFVAEVAVDLEHLLESADGGPLEVQLRGDPQEQVQVEGVHVRDERPRRGSRGDHLQHGRLDLDRKSTRLNSSHVAISYAVFCLKKRRQHNAYQ